MWHDAKLTAFFPGQAMEQAPHTPHALQCALMDIVIGENMIVDLVGVGGSFKTTFVGMVRCKLLIVRMPSAADLREHIYQNKQVMVKYLSRGEIRVFRTAVASVGFKPIPLLFLDYPGRIDTLKLRKAKRLECFFPAKLYAGERELAGSVTDLSMDGCRVSLPAKFAEAAVLAPDAALTVKFAFFSLSYDFEVTAKVKNVHVDNAVSVGLKFDVLGERMRQSLEDYFRIAGASLPED
jgi:hypothetical protein